MLKKYKEIIMYLIFGALTTIVSLFTYYLCTLLFLDAKNPFHLQLANIISWIISVSFAYATNRIFVFESKGGIIKEAISFFSSRVATLLMDMTLMFIFVSLINLPDFPVKISVQIIVIISNYILSKLIVFKKK